MSDHRLMRSSDQRKYLYFQTIGSFLLLFRQINEALRLNQFIPDSFGNVQSWSIPQSTSYIFLFTPGSFTSGNTTCLCGSSASCTQPQAFYCINFTCENNFSPLTQTIPGLLLGCSYVESLLSSTLECFFDPVCIEMLINYRTFELDGLVAEVNLTNITALDANKLQQFLPNTTLDTIISNLFVQSWTQHADFAAYYDQCQPDVCTYTYVGRSKPIYIITTVISLLSGLTVILQVIVPPAVKTVRQIYQYRFEHHQQATGAARPSLCIFLMQSLQNLRKLNLYERESEADNPILATRCYLISFLVSITILSLFVGLDQQVRVFTVESPSQSQFEGLQSRYAATIACPCSYIAVQYKTFVSVSPIYHQVCSSLFVSSNWLASVTQQGDISDRKEWFLLGAQFQLLSSMCTLADNAITQSTGDFVSNELINTNILSQSLFEAQINSSIETFIAQTSATFRHTLAYILDAVRSNQLVHQYLTNWQPIITTAEENYYLRWLSVSYNNGTCICGVGKSNCSRPIALYDNSSSLISLPGLVVGCLPIDGLRLSTLECLFDVNCVNRIRTAIQFTNPILALNASLTPGFVPNTTLIGSIIDELFVDLWLHSSNYSSYFASCAPSFCQYKYAERNGFVYLLITILGLYGGLTTALSFIVWHGLRLLRSLRLRYQRRDEVVPFSATAVCNL